MWAMPDPSRTSGRRIALVEDDASIGESVVAALTSQGYNASWYRDAASATRAFEGTAPELVLLDAGLPDVDGFSLCRWLRAQHRDLPIVLVTARDAEIDMIVGLDAGATDYVTKPFSINVLLARIRAHLRTVDDDDPHAPISLGALVVDPSSYVARVDGESVDLRPREFQLLVFLARRVGRVVTREELLSEVWDTHWETATKTVDMHVMALRRKLAGVIEITSVRGVGFRLEAP
jgi:DNA-binding response OmpR family regulator